VEAGTDPYVVETVLRIPDGKQALSIGCEMKVPSLPEGAVSVEPSLGNIALLFVRGI